MQGTTGFVFTPDSMFTSNFPIGQVNVNCIGVSYGASADGTWQGSGDTNQCGNGSTALTDTVYFTDPLGGAQSWTDPSPPTVTIANPTPPSLGFFGGSGSEAYIFPGDTGMANQTTPIYYCLTWASDVTITVVNASGQVVRTIQQSVSEQGTFDEWGNSQIPCGYYGYGDYYASWDGTDDQGQVVPPGQYTIDIDAVNADGSATLDDVADVATGTPGQLTSPTAGATVQGTTGFVFTPDSMFTSNFPIGQVNVNCIGVSYGASADGTWQGSGDTNQCGNGSTALTDTVYFTDPLGGAQSWTDPSPPTVTIANPTPPSLGVLRWIGFGSVHLPR